MRPCRDHPDTPYRGSATAQGYGVEHQRERAALLERSPWCVDPFKRHPGRRVRATVADHIKPKRLGGKELQPLCAPCHGHKTAYVDGGFGNKPHEGPAA